MRGKYKVVGLFCIPWLGMFALSELNDAGYWPLAFAIAVFCPILHHRFYHQD